MKADVTKELAVFLCRGLCRAWIRLKSDGTDGFVIQDDGRAMPVGLLGSTAPPHPPGFLFGNWQMNRIKPHFLKILLISTKKKG